MRLSGFFALSWFFILANFAFEVRAFEDHFCGLEIHGDERLTFTATEKEWLCGKTESLAWREIPLREKQTVARR